jgi:tRNA threonylcarbamoyladenosine biosynthesis protein TsaE
VRAEHLTSSEQETRDLARAFARTLHRGDVVALVGDLGTGKTRFVKGVAEAFGARTSVSSPSFVILNRYEGADADGKELLLHHLDLYRIRTVEEIYDIGYEEFVFGDGITLIEWAEQLGDLLPKQRYTIRFVYGRGESDRIIVIESPDTARSAT